MFYTTLFEYTLLLSYVKVYSCSSEQCAQLSLLQMLHAWPASVDPTLSARGCVPCIVGCE